MVPQNLKERELKALREIIDLLVPESVGLFGVEKETLLNNIINMINDGPELIGLKLRMIYNILKRCYEE